MSEARARVDKGKLMMTLVIAALAAWMWWGARAFPDRVALFPVVITTIVLVLSLLDLARILRLALAKPDAPADEAAPEVAEPPKVMSPAGAIGWLLVLAVPTLLFGFLIAVPVYMALFLRLHGRYSLPMIAISIATLWIVIYVVFVRLLNLPVYDGHLL